MSQTRRHFLKTAGSAALLAGSGCDRWPRALLPFLPPTDDATGPFQPPESDVIDPAAHVLNRLTFGPAPGDYGRVRKLAKTAEDAAAAFIEEQLQPETINDPRADYLVRRFETLREPVGELFEYKEDVLLEELTRAAVLRATFSKRQLYEVMVEFWSDHFNIDSSKGDCKWLKAADDRDVIRRHALGRFPELLRASALSPAMLWYLDGRVNRKQDGGDKPNENYARELLELHTLGVHGGYTQQDVMEVARCLTGWTVRSKEWLGIGRVAFKPELHDDGPKSVLGHRIPPGEGQNDLDHVLDIVGLHPATARHLATKLCRRFVDDNPPEEAVKAVAEIFRASAGDIRRTLRALFQTRAFLTTRGNKFKRPFHFLISTLRATGARTRAQESLLQYLLRMGQSPFQYPTPDGYPQESGPWMATLLWRWNFAFSLQEGKIDGTRIDVEGLKRKLGGDAGLMAHLLGRKATPLEAECFERSGSGLALLLASPAFQQC